MKENGAGELEYVTNVFEPIPHKNYIQQWIKYVHNNELNIFAEAKNDIDVSLSFGQMGCFDFWPYTHAFK
jgi:hypothetical protein